ncbi:MAG: radical SAM protein [Candidatus Omnitrophica bacterium]|nr:radical SAM protein [Candidatus Omnitrophota bacterium]
MKKFDTILSACMLCPRGCRVNRLEGEKGFCQGGARAKVASHNSHFGEEPPISGSRGSGTIFFSGCTLHCLFCQNYPISQLREGREVSTPQLVRMMLLLQKNGCHNLNLVTPTHFVPQILEAIQQAAIEGFKLPIVYNTSGYETMETLKQLEGVVSVYLPDLKYGNDKAGADISGVRDYFTFAGPAIKEMYRQVGNLKVDKKGVAQSGLIVRHLVLPDDLSTTGEVLRFLADNVSLDVTVSLMAQYFPAHQAQFHPELNRRVTAREYCKTVKLAQVLGLHNLFIQEISEF